MADFLSDLTGQLGGRITSTYRTPEQQAALRAQGATKTQHSTHEDGNAFDYVPTQGQSTTDVSNALAAFGYPGSHVLDETAPGQGTGPHYHISNPGFNGAFLPNGTPAPTRAQASAPNGADPLNPFGSAPQVTSAVTGAKDAIDNLATVMSNTDTALEANQATHAATVAASVEKKAAVAADQDTATRELSARATPLFQRQSDLAARQVEIQDMSPIKRAFLGLFNRNYDSGHVAAVQEAVGGELKALGSEYQFSTQARDQYLHDIDTGQQGADAIAASTEAGLQLDKTIAADTVQVAGQRLQNAVMGIQTGEQLTQAQILARKNTLGLMDAKGVNTALAAAKANGGTTTINGVPLTTAELQSRGVDLQEQDIGLQTAQVGLQNAKLAVQKAGEERLIAHMSDPEVAAAQANGGMFQGHRLDMNLLAQRVATGVARTNAIVNQTVSSISGDTYTQGVDRLNAGVQDSHRRMAGITGAQLPSEYQAYTNGMIAASQDWQRKIHAAPEGPARDQIRAMALADLGKRYSGLPDVVDSVVQGMTKNKDAQLLLGGFMKGQPLTQEATVKGMIGLYSGGGALPKGVQLSGPAAKMWAAGKAAYDSVVQRNGGQQSMADIMSGQGKITKDEFNRQLTQAVSSATGGAWNNALSAGLMQQLPGTAKALGHPAGNIRPADLAMATQAGDSAGIHAMAQRLGWSDDQAMQVFGPGGSKQAGYDAIANGKSPGKAKGVPYGQMVPLLQVDSNTAMLRALDASPSAQLMPGGVIPSHALSDFMTSNRYAQHLEQWQQGVPGMNFGNFMGDSVSSGSIASLMSGHGDGLTKAVGAIGVQDTQHIRDQAALYQNNPMKRAEVVLAAVPGMSQHDQQTLLAGLRQNLTGGYGALNTVVDNSSGSIGAAYTDQIDSQILHGKFQDPKLESLRRQAAKHWEDLTPKADSMMQRIWKSITG